MRYLTLQPFLMLFLWFTTQNHLSIPTCFYVCSVVCHLTDVALTSFEIGSSTISILLCIEWTDIETNSDMVLVDCPINRVPLVLLVVETLQ